MKDLVKAATVLTALLVLWRIWTAPRFCLCAGTICACGYRR
jgi:hypothetical protein